MEFGISTQIHRRQAVTVNLLETMRKAGYRRFELFCNRPHLDFHDRTLMRSIGRWFQQNALPPPSLHLPFVENAGPRQKIRISPLDPDPKRRATAIDEIKRSLELGDHVELSYVVMHLGNPGEQFTPAAFEYAYAAISLIRSFAGARVMIENILNEISTIDRIQEFKTAADVPDIGICYDTGHGHLQGITSGLEHIHAMHVNDNHGDRDQHLWPFEGTLNWPGLIEKLVVSKYKGPFIFEARGDDVTKGGEAGSRLQDLWEEAQNSLEEFRLKYKL